MPNEGHDSSVREGFAARRNQAGRLDPEGTARMEAAGILANFAAKLRFDQLPQGVVEKARQLILDQLGCELAGSTLRWGRQTCEYVRDNGGPRPESTVVNYGLQLHAQDAAFANASFGRSVEVDDVDFPSASHFGSVVIPAAIAVAQKERAGGEALVQAVVAGYEVACRIGAAGSDAIKRGFHPTTLFGPFGAATAAGILSGLDEEALRNALAIAASHACGIMEYSETGGSVNRLHGGLAAHAGVRAALLAQKGFSGPRSFLDGRKGFLPAFSREPRPGELTRALGEEFAISRVGLRRYCCCGTQNCALDALARITEKHAFRPDEIESIEVRVSSAAFHLVGGIGEPHDVTTSQFSGRYGAALRLVKGGNGFHEYFNEANLTDADVLRLVARTRYVRDERLDALYPAGIPAAVRVDLRDGTTYEETVHQPRGSVQNPMTDGERLDKFRELAGTVHRADRVEEIIETVQAIERADARKLGRLLSAG